MNKKLISIFLSMIIFASVAYIVTQPEENEENKIIDVNFELVTVKPNNFKFGAELSTFYESSTFLIETEASVTTSTTDLIYFNDNFTIFQLTTESVAETSIKSSVTTSKILENLLNNFDKITTKILNSENNSKVSSMLQTTTKNPKDFSIKDSIPESEAALKIPTAKSSTTPKFIEDSFDKFCFTHFESKNSTFCIVAERVKHSDINEVCRVRKMIPAKINENNFKDILSLAIETFGVGYDTVLWVDGETRFEFDFN